MTPDQFAAKVAEDWKAGLAGWGLGTERMRQLKDAADFTVYTPGSSAGVPLNVMGSLAAPPLSWESESETLRDEVEGFVSSLLGMAGIEADPISSREHILLSNLVELAWRAGRNLDLGTLIQQVPDPPIRKLGVFELDAFFPPKDRMALAIRLNGLVASPSFAGWLQGPALDIRTMLGSPEGGGRPRASIVYLAHLSDPERQFLVTLLLAKVVTWMRGLSGTTDLRALIYMDEVFGFVPPTAAPPSKKPILTILKQARAFGVGMLLATQNPVDLDYKAMSNAGTWFIGRLQTERDKARILEGLQSAGGTVDVPALDSMISGLEQRRFVLHNTHEGAPKVFQTRWAMSYLRGPLTREQIQTLTPNRPTAAAPAPAAAPQAADSAPESKPSAEIPTMPVVAPGVEVVYLDPAAPWGSAVGAVPGATRLEAGLVAKVRLRFDESVADVDHAEDWEAVFFPAPERFDPARALTVDHDDRDFRTEPPAGAVYVLPDAPIDQRGYFKEAASDLREHLTRSRSVTVFRNGTLKLYSRVGESREEFAARCHEAARAGADRETAKIRDRLEAKSERLRDALATARRQLQEAETNVRTRGQEEMAAGAGSVLRMILTGRPSTRSIGGMASRRGTKARAEQRARSAHARVGDKAADLQELERDLLEEVQEIDARWQQRGEDIDELEIGLESSDVDVDRLAVLWIPRGPSAQGEVPVEVAVV